jgi:hypothetical protein
LASS